MKQSKYKRFVDLTSAEKKKIKSEFLKHGDKDRAAKENGTTQAVVGFCLSCAFN